MGFLRFVYHSYTFKRIVLASLAFIVLLWVFNKGFDSIWGYDTVNPVISLEDFYQIPKAYDNRTKINIKMIDKDRAAIECNERFRTVKSFFAYYDTLGIKTPDTANPITNKIFLRYENSEKVDSLYLVLSKSNEPGIFWNQIFYSSVIVSRLNEFSKDTAEFRIHQNELVSDKLLADNDSLIDKVTAYFNANKDNLGLAECGTNCQIFKNICDTFHLPCKVITLQGGSALSSGFNILVGYPAHVVCEIYASKYRKWHVIDPTYGSVYRLGNEPLNAVEIANRVYFFKGIDIIQDSVLVTKNVMLGKDYFKFYENVYLTNKMRLSLPATKFVIWFFNNFNYRSSVYTFELNFFMNGLNYLIIKSLMYFILILIYLNLIILLMSKRLLIEKRKRHSQSLNKV